MFHFKSFLRLTNQSTQTDYVQTRILDIKGVHAFYIKGITSSCLEPDFGAGVQIQIDDVESWMADFRHSDCWCKPAFGNDLKEVPNQTQGLICRKKDRTYAVVLPVVSAQYKCVLMGGDDTTCVTAKLYSGCKGISHIDALAFMYAEGENPYQLLEACTQQALELLENGCKARKDRRFPDVFNYLGWCSWDAFGIKVSEENIINKCEEFKRKEIPVKWILLDDMWADVRDFYGMSYKDKVEMIRLMWSSKLYSFEAAPDRFPNGLKHTIDLVREKGFKVGVWHPTTGYWRGIDPSGEIYRDFKQYLIHTEHKGIIPDYKQDKAYMFFSAFHDQLTAAGAEFIKIDRQSITEPFYGGFAPIGEIARNFHNAIEASVGQHFDSALINCMGMSNENMWNRQSSAISRCSDDFQPESREWFIYNILQCSYNSVIQGQFYYCDWDMWWTDDGQAVKNSILRAISGGPIYVSDTLDRSLAERIKPLVFADGRILRCDRPAMPALDCLTVDPTSSGKIFKLQNQADASGILAVFNLDQEGGCVSGTISPSDVDGLTGEEFAVYEHFTKELRILGKNDTMEITLQDREDFRLYIIVPITDGYAPIGLVDKFISPKSIFYVDGKQAIPVESGDFAYVLDGKLFIEYMKGAR